MLEEQLPDYKLRVDSLYLYENPDWIQPPACHGQLPEVASPAREEDSFRYMSESVFIAPNTKDTKLDTWLILGSGQIWKTLDRWKKRLSSGEVLVVQDYNSKADLGCPLTAWSSEYTLK